MIKIPERRNWPLGNIPPELKQIRQWVPWKYQIEDGKLRKPPVNSSGYSIDENDPKNWMTFEEARAAYEKNKKIYGIGIALTPELNLVGNDRDHCIDANGQMNPDAEDDLRILNTYSEVSPSDEGIRTFNWGKLPFDGRKVGNCEIYKARRYLTVTGQKLPDAPATVNENQSCIDAIVAKHFSKNGTKPKAASKGQKQRQGHSGDNSDLTDAVLLGKAMSAKNGPKFKALWSGDISAYPSQSEADGALCMLLAYWWDMDAGAVDRMFRQSRLYRLKWDENHGDQTYGQMTINSAIAFLESQGGRDESEPEYFTQDGKTFRNVPTKGGTVPAQLANFECKIEREKVLDNGAETTVTFEMTAKLHGRTHNFELPACKFPGMAWVTEQLGASFIVRAGQGNRDHCRAAIQNLSGQPEREVLYTHTGWRKLPGVGWVYLTGSGALGANGFVEGVKTDLGQLSRFALPAPPTGAELAALVKEILDYFKTAPCGLSTTILLPFRAALNEAEPSDFSGYLSGGTGFGKSEWAALLQSFFGPELGYSRNLPGNFSSTANALEKLSFMLKDAICTMDDYCNAGGQSDVSKLNLKGDLVFRGAGNRSGRQRLNADGSQRATYYPRCMSVGTGEDIPAGQSLRARLLIWEFAPGAMTPERMSAAQALSRTGKCAQAMSGFIVWCASRMDDLKRTYAKGKEALRAELNTGSHARHSTTIADLLQCAEVFMEFCTDIKAAVEFFESRQWIDDIKSELLKVCDAQSEFIETENPGKRFLKLLGSALSAGRAHVVDARTGSVPAEDAHLWGWAWKGLVSAAPDTYGEDVKHFYPQGERIGWLAGGDLYLDPEAAHACIQRLGRDQGQNLLISQGRLWKTLKTSGLLAATDKDNRNTHKCKLDGAYRATIHLRADQVVEMDKKSPTQEEQEWLMTL